LNPAEDRQRAEANQRHRAHAAALRSREDTAGRQSPVKVGVFVDHDGLAAWQADALRRLGPDVAFVIYDCLNSRPERRRLRFALYYLLNLFTVRNPLTRRADVPADLHMLACRPFESEWEGVWQRLPGALLKQIRGDAPDVLVKFGMGLLRVPDATELPVPILSYHHGNPERFRGRPAGFYEMLSGERVMGQVVQRLSNALDSGEVAATAETRVVPHSYRSTLMQAYAVSPLLLAPAIRTVLAEAAAKPAHPGRNYRLPGNLTVLRLVAAMAKRALARLGYGLFKEKIWRVATVAAEANIGSVMAAMEDRRCWSEVPTPRGYRFLADPFFHPDGGLLVEGLATRSARGRLLWIDGGRARVVSGRGGHFSYPCCLEVAGSCFVIPEVSDWAPALAYPIAGERLGEPFELALPGRPRLLDPTGFVHGGVVYLFGNVAAEGGGVLRLWSGDRLDGEFVEHPASPIRISPDGGRMGGAIVELDNRLMRIGQDFRGGYGDGLSFFHIQRIDRDTYVEERAGGFRLKGVHGPHTLNLAPGRAVFDYYAERVSPLAGWRRFTDRRAAGRIAD
jgi:hypothetical protein